MTLSIATLCHYAEGCIRFIVMLCVIILSVVMLWVVMLCVVMLCVFMLCAVMLCAVLLSVFRLIVVLLIVFGPFSSTTYCYINLQINVNVTKLFRH